jgi:hypothetical protein
LDRLWEWETLIPNVTPLPQISHFANCCTSNREKFVSITTSVCIITETFEKSKRKNEKNIFFSGTVAKSHSMVYNGA